MKNITLFEDFWHTDSPHYVTLDTVIDRIRTGRVQSKIDDLRENGDPAERDKIKKSLPCICFSGKFLKRKDESLFEHSGLIVLDFDTKIEKGYPVADPEGWQKRHPGAKLVLPEPKDGKEPKVGTYALVITDAALFRDALKQYPFLTCAFISPSGAGVKAVARVPAIISQHRGHYEAILREFEVLDPTSRNESRICYDSVDTGVWVNNESEVFEKYIIPQTIAEPIAPRAPGPVKTDYGKLNKCADMIRNASDGGKHEALLKASRLAGGYIASGTIEEDIAIRLLESEIEAKSNVLDMAGARRTIRDGIENGKRIPIYEQTPEERPIPKGFAQNGVVRLADVWHGMDNSFHYGKARGETTHFPDLDQHFTWKRGDFTVVSGRPGSGKSEWVLQLMLIKSLMVGWKWAIFSPESFPAGEFYDSLIHSLVGKTPDPIYGEYQMKLSQYEEAANFIDEHFFYVYPDTDHTIEEVESNFLHLVKTENIAGVLIDPYNQLSQDFSLRDDQYLQKFITIRKRFALENDVCYLTVVHPKAMQKNSNGEYDVVDAYDLANGAMWINKTDNFISIYRPNQATNPKDTSVEIHVKKIKKQKLVGVPGSVFWTFDRRSNRYYSSGESPLEIIQTDADGKGGTKF